MAGLVPHLGAVSVTAIEDRTPPDVGRLALASFETGDQAVCQLEPADLLDDVQKLNTHRQTAEQKKRKQHQPTMHAVKKRVALR